MKLTIDAGSHPETAGDLLGAARLPGAALHRPQEDGAAQLRRRVRRAAHGRGAGGRRPPLLQRLEHAHGQELATLLLALGDGRNGQRYCSSLNCLDTAFGFAPGSNIKKPQ